MSASGRIQVVPSIAGLSFFALVLWLAVSREYQQWESAQQASLGRGQHRIMKSSLSASIPPRL